MKTLLLKYILPWSITLLLLYFAFRGIDWPELYRYTLSSNPTWLLCAVLLTVFSYLFRSLRWPAFFPGHPPKFLDSYRVLILGFFMNNILPARAGELVRAHLGSRITGDSRTLILATIFSERVADGITLSGLVAATLFLSGRHGLDPEYASGLSWVAFAFGAITIGVIAMLLLEPWIVRMLRYVGERAGFHSLTFLTEKIEVFISGLKPLLSFRIIVRVIIWSLIIWGTELLVFQSIGNAAHFPLTSASAVLFLAAVNFSSLIPAAPGGFGVIEFIAKHALLSLGVPSEEQALAMVLLQHIIQYLVVGVPGAWFLATWQKRISLEQEPGLAVRA